MKYLILTLITLSLFACNKKKNDLAGEGLKGNVKQVITKTYEVSEKFGDIQKGKLTRTSIADYNTDGNTEKISFVYSPDSVNKSPDKHLFIYEYENGKKVSERNGITSKKTEDYKYDSDNLVEINHYNDNGTLDTKTKLNYNTNDLVEELIVYNGDGSLKSKIINKYNSDKLIKEQDELNSENKIITVTWLNHDADNRLSAYRYKSKDFTSNRSFKYSNIEKGNWLKAIDYYEGKPDRLTEREIKYY